MNRRTADAGAPQFLPVQPWLLGLAVAITGETVLILIAATAYVRGPAMGWTATLACLCVVVAAGYAGGWLVGRLNNLAVSVLSVRVPVPVSLHAQHAQRVVH